MAPLCSINFRLVGLTAADSRKVICCSGAVPLSPAVRGLDDEALPSRSSVSVPRLEPCVAKQRVPQQTASAGRQHTKRRRDVTKALDRENVTSAVDSLLRCAFYHNCACITLAVDG